MRLAPHPFTLRQLQYVVAVAEQRSFHRAAEVCRVAQPSLSTQIADVEARLGVQLFERDRRRVLITPAGDALVARARSLLVASDDLVDAASTFADPFSATLRVGVIPTVAPYLLPEFASALRARYPRLSIVWVEEKTTTLAEKLDAAELDAAIVALVPELAPLEHVVIGRDAFVFAAGREHKLAKLARPIRADEITGERVLLLDDGHCFREQALAFCSRAGTEELNYRATSLATLAQMVAGGAGVTLLPSSAAATESKGGDLAVRAIAPHTPFRTLALVFRKGAPAQVAVRAVGAVLRDAYERFVERPLAKRAGTKR